MIKRDKSEREKKMKERRKWKHTETRKKKKKKSSQWFSYSFLWSYFPLPDLPLPGLISWLERSGSWNSRWVYFGCTWPQCSKRSMGQTAANPQIKTRLITDHFRVHLESYSIIKAIWKRTILSCFGHHWTCPYVLFLCKDLSGGCFCSI